jgi:hypothetical protein
MRTGLQVEQIEVETRPLREIIIQYAPSVTTDFMKVDVEGFERTVLLSADWRVFRPRVILVESIRPASSEPSHQGWEDVLLNAGYSFALFDGVNAFYVRDADKDLMVQFNAGVNVNDHWRRAEAADM